MAPGNFSLNCSSLLVCWQIVDAKEAGAGGVLGTIASVSVRATPVLSSFAAALGLDAPVEVAPCQLLHKHCWRAGNSALGYLY